MMTNRQQRDIEKQYSIKETVDKLRRLADCLEAEKPFRIQIAGERITVPASAVFSIEHEREGNKEEVEFQFKWGLKIEDFAKLLEVSTQSISFSSVKRKLGSGRKFRNVQSIREFVEKSLSDGVLWTCEKKTPHFRYQNIGYYLNGDFTGRGNESIDAIALPWGELEKRGLTERNIQELIKTKSLDTPYPKPKSSKLMGLGENRGGYLCIGINNWRDIRSILDYISNR
jgi:amphi-Trp domain-containing protein